MKDPANSPVPAIRFHTGTPRSRSTATTPIVFLPLIVMAKLQSSLSPARSHDPPVAGARRLRSTLTVGFRLRHRRPRKHAHMKFIRRDCSKVRSGVERTLPDRISPRGERMRSHVYARRPRFTAVFLCGGLVGRAVLTSRSNARRINSERLVASRRAFSSRSCWTSRGRRNVTGTLPLGSFVLGMKPCVLLYHTLCQD
jgi:hypothetical protein